MSPTRRNPARIRGHLLACVLLCAPAGIATQQAAGNALVNIYRTILADVDSGQLPKLEQVTDVLDTIDKMPEAEIREAFPLFEEAAQSKNGEVRKYGMLGFVSVAMQRADSASMMTPLVPVIAGHLRDSDIGVRRGALFALSNMKPKPPESVVDILKAELKHDQELAPGIVSALVYIDANRADIADAVRKYLHSETLSTDERINTLNALATVRIEDSGLIDEVIRNLSSSNEDILIAAIRVLRRCGPVGVERARTRLEEIENSSQTSERVKSTAKVALQSANSR